MKGQKLRDHLLGVLFLLAATAALLAWSQFPPFERRSIVLRNARGMPLRIVVFEPLDASRPRPAIVVCQPVNSPPEAGQALILEFLRRGWLAATFDFRGTAPDENRALLRENVLNVTALDAAAALAYLASRPDVDRTRIGLIGHSFGGTLAIRAGIEQPWVRATVAVGIAGDVTKNLPQNLVWLVGLYDEFRPLLEMHEVMEASNSEGIAEIERTAGDFARGTARRLSVTVTADHFTEFWNHGTAVRAVEWFASAFEGRPVAGSRLAAGPWFSASYSLAFLLGWLLVRRRLQARSDRQVRASAQAGSGLGTRLVSLSIAAFLVGLVIVPLPRLAILRADLAMWGLALLLAVNAEARPGRFFRLVLFGWASLLITLVVNQVAYFWRYPQLLYALPAFPFWHATGVLNSYLFIYPRGLLFSGYTEAVLRPGWVFWGLLALEVARPGVVLRGLANVAQRASPRSEKTGPQPRTGWALWLVVLALFGALAAIVSMRAAQGFVDRESLRLAGWVLLRFAVLPFFVFALLKRRFNYSEK